MLSSIFLTITINAQSDQLPASEINALEALYNSTDGPNWDDNTGWLTATDPCTWYGVECVNEHVAYLYLDFNGLTGTLPPALGNLSNLEELDLSTNQLSGPIPPEIGDLTNLLDLWLFDNQLSGEIPSELGSLSNLEELDLSTNQLSGPIPPEIGNLTNLYDLILSSNLLEGEIPLSITNLDSFIELDIGYNSLTSSNPVVINFIEDRDPEGGASQTVFQAEINILETFYYSTDGPYWNNATNWLSSAHPRFWYGVYTFLGHVIEIYLDDNNLYYSIPSELGDLSGLKYLLLPGNQLQDSIPLSLGNLTFLEELDLSDNILEGGIPSSLGNLTFLEYLNLSGNELNGQIPSEIGDLTFLEELDLSDNFLEGGIPSSLGNLTFLEVLDLSGNFDLEGEIPSEIGDLTNLQHLDLSGNQLNGQIPSEIGDLTDLLHLDLGSNQLNGQIPSEIGDLTNLEKLFLFRNQLSGEIPVSITNLVNLDGFPQLYGLILSNNCLTSSNQTVLDFLAIEAPNWNQYQDECGSEPTGVPPTAYEYALMSKLAYAYDPDHRHHGEKDALLGKLPNWVVKGVVTLSSNDDNWGYWGVAFYNSTTRHLVIAHRGTNLEGFSPVATLRDIRSVIQIAVGEIPQQFDSALAFRFDIFVQHPNLPEDTIVSHTGHSLGGTLAQIVAACDESLRAVTFDSPGSIPIFEKLYEDYPNLECDLNKLDANEYVGPPNVINTAIEHVGELRLTQPDWADETYSDSLLSTETIILDLTSLYTIWSSLGFPLPGTSQFDDFMDQQESILLLYLIYSKDAHSFDTIKNLLGEEEHKVVERPDIGVIVSQSQWPVGLMQGYNNYVSERISPRLCDNELCRQDLSTVLLDAESLSDSVIKLAQWYFLRFSQPVHYLAERVTPLMKNPAGSSLTVIENVESPILNSMWISTGLQCVSNLLLCPSYVQIPRIADLGFEGSKFVLSKIEADPPDPDYTEIAILSNTIPVDPPDSSEFGIVSVAIANKLNEYIVILEAFLTSFERLQGAALDGDQEYILLQTMAVRNYLQMWYDNQTEFAQLLRTYADTYPDLTDSMTPEALALLSQWQATGIGSEYADLLKGFGLTDDQIAAMSAALQEGGSDDLSQLYEWADVIETTVLHELTAAINEIEIFEDELEQDIDISIPNTPPVADVGGPYVVNEGNATFLDGAGTDEDGGSLSFTWDLDNDGTFETLGENPLFSATGQDGPAIQPVILQVCDMFGVCDTDETIVEILNAAPGVVAGEDMILFSGETLTIEAHFTDPGMADIHTATINFGNGPEATVVDQGEGFGMVSASKQFFVPGTYIVEVCVTDDDGDTGCDSLEVKVKYVPVVIDIKPDSDPNSINLGSNGNVTVAILGSENFNVTSVDSTTVTLADAPGATKRNGRLMKSYEDVNGDGFTDMILHFDTQALNLTTNSIEAMLKGETLAGISFQGTDTVRVVPSSDAPMLLSPSNGSISTQETVELTWSHEQGTKCYLFQLDNNSDFSSPEQTATVVNSNGTTYLQLAGGLYYWRVQVGGDCKSIKKPSPWSEVWSFTVNT